MNFRKLALGIVPALVLCSAPMTWSVSAESGTAGNITWTIEDNVCTLHAASFDMIFDDGLVTITGTTYQLIEDDLTGEEMEAMQPLFDFAENFDVKKVVIDVNEYQSELPFLKNADEISIVLTEKVSYVAENSLYVPKYSTVTVRNPELSLDGSGLGYDANNEVMVIGICGYVGSPAEAYANNNEAFEFFPLEASGKWDEDGMITWEIKNELLTLYAADGSYKLEVLPDKFLITGTAFTGLPFMEWSDDNMTLLMFVNNTDYAPDRIVVDVERIDFDAEEVLVTLNTEGTTFVLTEKVQSICESGLGWIESDTDVYVESRTLSLDGSELGQLIDNEDTGTITIHGYADSPAQAYAKSHALPFVVFDTPLPVEPTEPLALGDVSGNGNIDASDAAVLLAYAAQLGAGLTESDDIIKLTTAQLDAADINKDGEYNATDAAIILAYSASIGSGQDDAKIEDFIS